MAEVQGGESRLPPTLAILPFLNKVLLPGAVVRVRIHPPARFVLLWRFFLLRFFLHLGIGDGGQLGILIGKRTSIVGFCDTISWLCGLERRREGRRGIVERLGTQLG